MKRSEPVDARNIVAHIETWLLASIDLGKEILTLHDIEQAQQTRLFASGKMERISSQEELERMRLAHLHALQEIQDELLQIGRRFQYKCSLFLVALNKIARWGHEMKEAAPNGRMPVDAFLEAFAPGKVVRNIREHDDEYLTGGGRRRDQLFATAMDGLVRIDATSTLVLEGEILLGGRLSVQKMLVAADQLREALRT